MGGGQVSRAAVRDFNVTGLSVGVVCNHTVAYTGGFGWADAAGRTAAAADTLYQVASNSKAFTAMVALQMVQEGKLDLDAPARDAHPGFRVLDGFGSTSITLRDMMSHRTGLPRHDQITFAATNRSSMMEAIPFLPFDKAVRYQPGEYNNMMFAGAGALEEAVGGRSWEQEVQTRVFDRLNMSASSPTLARLTPAMRAKFARCHASFGGARDLDKSTAIDCLDADAAGPCGSVISSVADFVKWQAMHMRQAVRACGPSSSGAPFFNGPRDQIQCPPGTANGPIAGRAADEPYPGYLLRDDVWKEYVRPNTIFPDWNAFGTYSLGLWWEQLYPEPDMWCLHHAGDLPGMASKQAMLPWLGHSVVVLSNQNESPARFAIVLQILDFMTGHAPPAPNWTDTYLTALAAQHNSSVAAEAAWGKAVQAARMRPGGGVAPDAGALAGSYAHPAYGNCTVAVAGAGLQLSGCATIWAEQNAAPWVPGVGALQHLFFDTFAVVGTDVILNAGSPTLSFFSTRGDGVFDRFESQLEPNTPPIVFAKAGYRGQGVGYSYGARSAAYVAGAASYSWPLPSPDVYA